MPHVCVQLLYLITSYNLTKIIKWMWRFVIKWVPAETCIQMPFHHNAIKNKPSPKCQFENSKFKLRSLITFFLRVYIPFMNYALALLSESFSITRSLVDSEGCCFYNPLSVGSNWLYSVQNINRASNLNKIIPLWP